MREMGAEIGTSSAELLCEHETWLYYDIPLSLADRLWHGQYKGQKQKWMALRFTGKDEDININTAEPEFCEWRWLEMRFRSKRVCSSAWLERTPDKGEVPGSNPGWPNGGIAQLVERCLCTANVSGSSPLISTVL